MEPLFISSGEGAILRDVDGNEFIDYVGSWGALILGHAHPAVLEEIHNAVSRGTTFGAPTEAETALAELLCETFPSIDLVRLVNSGTEATMTAIRLARGFTKRNKIVKFEGCYHGHVDSLLMKAGSGLSALVAPDSAGIPGGLLRETLVAAFNDSAGINQLFEEHGAHIAAVIVEPVPGNMGVILPEEGFFQQLRELTQRHNALLIFDEVITGFRVTYGGAQTLWGITPDLTCLGKIIGGGFPIGAIGGKKEIMENLAPDGPVYQAGSLSGNPVAVTAGLTTLELLREEDPYSEIGRRSGQLAAGLVERAQSFDIPAQSISLGGMWSLFFSETPVKNLADTQACDADRFSCYFQEMLQRGVYLGCSLYEAGFISMAHTDGHVESTLEAAEVSFQRVVTSG